MYYLKEDKRIKSKIVVEALKNRNDYIDLLRFLGLSLIILAHVNPPDFIFQIRCFDVPLMVFISGLAFGGKNVDPSFMMFYLPRIKRLLIPVYLFLSIYFLFFHFCCRINYTPQYIINSFLLLKNNSIGFLWIIRVFLLVMIATPALLSISKKFSAKLLLTSLAAIIIFQELLSIVSSGLSSIPILGAIWDETIPFLTGYSICFLFGCYARNANPCDEKKILISLIIALTFFSGIWFIVNGEICQLQKFKYPPQHIYILYGITISCLLWYARRISQSIPRFILFIGNNTLWIYLWHIIVLIAIAKFFPSAHWGWQYLLTYFLSVILFGGQYLLVSKFNGTKRIQCLKYLIG